MAACADALMFAAVGYAVTVSLGGSGFITAWVAGLVFGVVWRRTVPPDRGDHRPASVIGLAEELGNLLASLSFFVFGAVLLGPALSAIDWRIALYALLSLTVLRMVPVAISLAGSRFGYLPCSTSAGSVPAAWRRSSSPSCCSTTVTPPPKHWWTSSHSPWGSASPCMGRARPGRPAPTGSGTHAPPRLTRACGRTGGTTPCGARAAAGVPAPEDTAGPPRTIPAR